MPIKLIIFDLDGTLVDTARDITESLNHAIRPHGLGPISVEETTGLIGEGTTRLIEKALEKGLASPLGAPEETVKENALKNFLKHYSEHLCVHSTTYPNVMETLKRLPAFKKVVLSNKREDLSVKLLEDLGLKDFFTLIAGSDTTGAKKPSPETVRYMLQKTGTAPAEALMVGDSPYDIAAASGAGVTTVAATWGYRDRSLLAGADYMIEDIGELMPLLIKLQAIEEKRREPRHRVPPAYRDHLELSVRSGGEKIPATLLDFSDHGIMIKIPSPLEVGSLAECELGIPRSLTHTVSFTGRVRHSERWDEHYIAGMEIEEVSDEIWFRVLKKIHDFIIKRPEMF